MNKEVFEKREQALHARALYNSGQITREEAKNYIEPYVILVNQKSTEIAKKYGMRPKLISFSSFVR